MLQVCRYKPTESTQENQSKESLYIKYRATPMKCFLFSSLRHSFSCITDFFWFPSYPSALFSLYCVLIYLSLYSNTSTNVSRTLCLLRVSWIISTSFFFKIYLLFIYFIYFWLHRVSVAAHRIFVEASGLFVAACGILSSCGVWVFSSLVVVHSLQGAWAL